MSTKIYSNARFGFREDTLENWMADNPILEKGEPAVVRDGENGEWLKIGDGVTAFNNLPWKKGPKGDNGDKGDTGADGKDAITDQTYNPESENAQSGKAVAEALKTVNTDEVWRKIADITLEENAVVTFSEDMDGNTVSLKKFKVLAELPEVTTATILYLKINNVLSVVTPNSIATAKNPSYSIEAEYTFDWQFLTCVNNSNAYTNGTVNATPYGHRYANGSVPFPCTSISLSLNAAFTSGLPSGTRIRIWGIDE